MSGQPSEWTPNPQLTPPLSVKMDDDFVERILLDYAGTSEPDAWDVLQRALGTQVRVTSSRRFKKLRKARWFEPGLIFLVDEGAVPRGDQEADIRGLFEPLPRANGSCLVNGTWNGWDKYSRKYLTWEYAATSSRVDLGSEWQRRMDPSSGAHVRYLICVACRIHPITQTLFLFAVARRGE